MRISDWSSDVCSSDLGGEEIRADYIQAFLDGRILSLPVKSDESRVYDYDEPMLSGVNRVSKDDVLYHSVLTRYVGGIGGTLSYHSPHYKHYKERGKSKVIALNTDPLNLFRIEIGKESCGERGVKYG